MLLLSVALGPGCAAMGTLQTADTVGAGKTRGSAQVLAQRVTEPALLTAPVPRVAVGVEQRAMRFDNAMASSEQRHAALPVRVGWETAGGSQRVLGLRPTWLHFPGEQSLALPAENAFALGGSLGYAFRVGMRVRLMPEVAVMRPVGPLPRATGLRWEGAKPHVQFGLAFMLDGGGDE